jgi:hypothetical protein
MRLQAMGLCGGRWIASFLAMTEGFDESAAKRPQ